MSSIRIDPEPRHEISPRFYMQFMEPLGTTDSSVAACWNVLKDDWREDFVAVVRDLAPGSIRWGGILTSFWKWREGIGAPSSRKPMVNYLWGGVETNRVGVDEFLDFCERVAAEPIMAVNFAGDGRPEYLDTVLGEKRAGTPEEAADLVSYCNDPDNVERRANGREKPWNVRTWQIGNETSYPKDGSRFTATENAEHYAAFANAMRARDPSITLIGWGDQERDTGTWWAAELLERAGDMVDMVALHMMMQRPASDDTVLIGRRYRDDYHRTWNELGEIYETVADKLANAREAVAKTGVKLAITEGHLSLRPHNKNEILREWISGLYHARVLTLFERNADIIDIATLADFAGQSWTVNAVLLGSPNEQPYLLPVGHVMKLFRKFSGTQGLHVECDADNVAVSASRTADRLFVHAANLDLENDTTVSLEVTKLRLGKAMCHRIAPGDLDAAIDTTNLDVFSVETVDLSDSPNATLSAASVNAFEIEIVD